MISCVEGTNKTTLFLECQRIFGICQYAHLFHQPQTAAQDVIWWKRWRERLHFILIRWEVAEVRGGVKERALWGIYFSIEFLASIDVLNRYFKTYSEDTKIQVFHVCCVYIFCPCLRGFPQLLWALLTDVRRFGIAPRCERKACVLGSPIQRAFLSLARWLLGWTSGTQHPLIGGTSGRQIMHGWP